MNKMMMTAVAALALVTGAKATLRIPLDPKIESNYAQPDKKNGIPIITKAEEYLGTDEVRNRPLDSFVDLGSDGIAVIDLLEFPIRFLGPKRDRIVGIMTTSFLRN
jgi:hypothetical protein